MMMKWSERLAADPLPWLLDGNPWTRYRTLVELLHLSADDAEVLAARQAMMQHPLAQDVLERARSWPGYALKRHNDAAHPLHALAVCADLGIGLPELGDALEAVLAHQSSEGAFETLIHLSKRFTGLEGDIQTWMACDAPVLLYTLLAAGLDGDPRVQRAWQQLESIVDDNGYRCRSAPALGRFRGPGRREDPCPIANVYALRASSATPSGLQSQAARRATEMLLWHWEHQDGRKLYLFGIGRDFCRLKYPFVWYDILHVVDVLSRFPYARSDPRFQQMLDTILEQGDEHGRFTARSMYRAWKGWDFADKKAPSPWITFLVCRILERVAE